MHFIGTFGKRFGHLAKPVLSSLLVWQMLGVLVLAACPGLHHVFHHDSDRPGHECLVTAFVKGQLSEAEVPPLVVVSTAFLFLAAALPAMPGRSLFDFRCAPTRGPPLR